MKDNHIDNVVGVEEALRVITCLTAIKPLLQNNLHQVKKNLRLGGRFHTPVLIT